MQVKEITEHMQKILHVFNELENEQARLSNIYSTDKSECFVNGGADGWLEFLKTFSGLLAGSM